MKIKTSQTCIRTVKQGDPLWLIKDGPIISARAGFEISRNCPTHILVAIGEAIEYGYLKPVAFMKDTEQTWEILQDGSS